MKEPLKFDVYVFETVNASNGQVCTLRNAHGMIFAVGTVEECYEIYLELVRPSGTCTKNGGDHEK